MGLEYYCLVVICPVSYCCKQDYMLNARWYKKRLDGGRCSHSLPPVSISSEFIRPSLPNPFVLTGDFSGEENIPSSSSMPCSSRLPSFNVIPVRLKDTMRVSYNAEQNRDLSNYLPAFPTFE